MVSHTSSKRGMSFARIVPESILEAGTYDSKPTA